MSFSRTPGRSFSLMRSIGAVDHRGGAVEQRDLVGRFDLARAEHDLLGVLDRQPGLLQFEHHRRLDDVDADRHLGDAGGLEDRRHLLGVMLHQAECRIDGAAQADEAGLAVLRLEPRRIELVVDGGRAEVPQDRILAADQQRPARKLVAGPFADLGRGDVADVVVVEQQQRAELGLLQRGVGAGEPVALQAAVVDALLEVDAHGAEHRQMAAPVVARVDVLGPDLVGSRLVMSSMGGSSEILVAGRGRRHGLMITWSRRLYAPGLKRDRHATN